MNTQSFWQKSVLFAVAAVIGSGIFGISASSARSAEPTPVVPFEKLFARERGDSKVLRFNGFSGEIPGKRIKALLRSGPILGDRVLLSEDVAVYFPDGYIVQSQARLAKYVPTPGLKANQVLSRANLMKNPRYNLVVQFDGVLGNECARVSYAQGFASLRINRSGVMSLVTESPGIFDAVTGEPTTTYDVTSAVQPVFMGNKGLLPDLIRLCQSGTPKVAGTLTAQK
ncbi:hypothetical protein [Thalassospira mesophila]|uniref:hypothetical protein n=1 Tax=Thalassospira mesophila TaxID=1293891 RepID=UPI000A1F450A|nr:hypothetical protein [Thalassospira mesophila]